MFDRGGPDLGGLRQMHKGSRLLSRTMLKPFVRLIPAVAVLAFTMDLAASNTPGLLRWGASDSAASPTSTSTPGNGSLAFVSNLATGTVASFTRNTTTGVLKRTAITTAGAKSGPKGLAISSGAGFLYVANKADDNIYEYAVNQSNGVLTPLSTASVSNGSKSGPDEIAINPAGKVLFVTGFPNGTVTSYAINRRNGQLTQVNKHLSRTTNASG